MRTCNTILKQSVQTTPFYELVAILWSDVLDVDLEASQAAMCLHQFYIAQARRSHDNDHDVNVVKAAEALFAYEALRRSELDCDEDDE